jgi:hypothetical protein
VSTLFLNRALYSTLLYIIYRKLLITATVMWEWNAETIHHNSYTVIVSVINYLHSVNYFDIDKYLDFALLKGQFHEMNIVLRDIHFYSYYAMMVFKCVTKLLPCFRKVYVCLPILLLCCNVDSKFAGRLWRFRRVYAWVCKHLLVT